MKTWSIAVLLTANTMFANLCLAEENVQTDGVQTQPLLKEIPTEEKAFVDAINNYDKAKIIAQLGEPSKADDVRIKGSDKIVASIWHYHNINKATDGTYYPTTELDFIDDKVVQVVFLNNDGSEGSEDGKAYELPQAEPDSESGM